MTDFKDTTGETHEVVDDNFTEAPDGVAIEAGGRTIYSRGSCRNDLSALRLAAILTGSGRAHIRPLEPGEGQATIGDLSDNPIVAWHRKNFPDVDLIEVPMDDFLDIEYPGLCNECAQRLAPLIRASEFTSDDFGPVLRCTHQLEKFSEPVSDEVPY